MAKQRLMNKYGGKTQFGIKTQITKRLMKIAGLLSTEKKTESLALIQEFKGFSRDKLKAFETGLLEESASQ